jgi:hypothetical protein
VQVSPDPAHHLQTKITYRVLPQFLLEDHALDALPWFEQPAVLGFSVELADGRVFFPVEVDTGDESSIGPENLVLRLWLRKPSSISRTRLTDSPTLSLRTSRNSTTRHAARIPGQRFMLANPASSSCLRKPNVNP